MDFNMRLSQEEVAQAVKEFVERSIQVTAQASRRTEASTERERSLSVELRAEPIYNDHKKPVGYKIDAVVRWRLQTPQRTVCST